MNYLISSKTYKTICLLSKRIVLDATKKLKAALEKNVYLGNIFNFPVISEKTFGPFPSFSDNFMGKEPIDYTYIFSHHDVNKILYNTLDGYSELIDFFLDHKRIAKIFIYNIKSEKARNLYIPFINDLIERYLTLYTTSFDEKQFAELFLEMTKFYVSKKLNLEMWIPILLTNFEKDYIEIDENYYIKKLNKLEQLSRIRVKYYGSSVHETVMGLSNFVLVRKNLELNLPQPHVDFSLTTLNTNFFAKDEIDLYFLAQQMICLKKSGYSQVIYNPLNWGTNYKGYLMPLSGFSIREYPESFDDYVWLNKNNFIDITEHDMNEIIDLFLYFKNSKSVKLKNALNRLRYCLYRTKEEDSILDAVIAMESLLDDNTQGEITFKVCLRMSYIISLYNKKIDPNETFGAMQKIYKFRSNIVHGNVIKDKDNKIIFDKKEYSTNELAIEFLMCAIKTIKNNPCLLDKFDNKILHTFV